MRHGLLLLALLAAPAAATVPEGVARWRAGDWANAVAEWVAPAARGDADALFNLGQAYKLGRGVPQNLTTAQDYYRRAADKGHVAATANLGITLYQAGRKTEALTWLRNAADKGDIRAAYVLGVAAFNGDGAPRNTTLGYAYMIRARDGGLAQADAQAARMAVLLTPIERGRGEAAAAALAAGEPVPVELVGVSRAPVQTAAATPSAADRGEDEAEAAPPRALAFPPPPTRSMATVSNMPTRVPPPAAPVIVAASPPVAAPSPAPPRQIRMTEDQLAGAWLVQLGAYNSEGAARTAWATLVAQQADALVGARPVYNPRGGLFRLQVGPFDDRGLARDLCAKLSAAGRPCFVTRG